jgi:virginiamycin B lyase
MTVLLLAYAHTAAAQTITEFPVPIGGSIIAAGPDGALWFARVHGDKIGRITTAGTVTGSLIPVPPGTFVCSGIAAGPDGALWFGIAKAQASGRLFPGEFLPPGPTSRSIARITTTGEFSEFLLPPGYPMVATLKGITTGPDGALWFTEAGTNKIHRITTAGAISEFLLPTPNSVPIDITAGPDGALWFTEGFHDRNNGDKIGRITTAGAISEFLIPTPNSESLGITAGPDGALWFIERVANKIGRITTAGAVSEFLPTPNSGLGGITAGPDGAVWFTASRNGVGKIGRIGQSDEDVNADQQTFHIGQSDEAVKADLQTFHIGQRDEDVNADPQTFYWERWILYLEIVISLAIIIARRLRRLHLH